MSQVAGNTGRDLMRQLSLLRGEEQSERKKQEEGKEVFRTCGDILKGWEMSLGWDTSPTPEPVDSKEKETAEEEESKIKALERDSLGNKEEKNERNVAPEQVTHSSDREKEAQVGARKYERNTTPEPATHSSGRDKIAQAGARKKEEEKELESKVLKGKEYPTDGTPWVIEEKEEDPRACRKGDGIHPSGQREEGPSHRRTIEEMVMEWEGENQIGLASLHRLGKRKRERPGMMEAGQRVGGSDTSTEEEETVRPIRRKSKSHRRTTQVTSEEDGSGKVVAPPKGIKLPPPMVGRWAVRDKKTGKFISTQSCSEGDEKGTQRKRKEPTIEERMRPIPDCVEEIEDAPAAQTTAAALEWLEDIEVIRSRSSFQGVLSRRIKERVAAIKKSFEVLAVRMEEQGDLAYYKRKNLELRGQLLTSQREIKRMDKRISDLQKTIEELRSLIVNNEGIKKADKSTSPLQESRAEIKENKRTREDERMMEDLPPETAH